MKDLQQNYGKIIAGLTVSVLLIMASCAVRKKNAGTTKTQAPKSETDNGENGWQPRYNYFLKDAIQKYGPNHHKIKCPLRTYKSMLFAESGGDIYDQYIEKSLGSGGKFKREPYKGRPYMSEGLFQLSVTDELFYKCNFKYWEDAKKKFNDKSRAIFNPKNQFDCAVKILDRQLMKYGKLYYNKSYWAVLRPNRPGSHKGYRWYRDIKFKNECGL